MRRTRAALRGALLVLLREVGWDAIDVALLCNRADVARSTFYLHYGDKTDLLRGAFEDLRGQLTASIADTDRDAPFPFLPGLLAHVHEHREVFRALLGRRSGQVVQQHFLELLSSMFSSAARPPRKTAGAREHLLAGGFFQLLVWWLGTHRPQQPADVEALFLAFSVQPPRG